MTYLSYSRLLVTVAASLCFSFIAEAGPIALPVNTWVTEPFTLMNPGNGFPDTYIATVGGNLLVTGYYVTGDYYGISVNGTLALTTPQVSPINVDYGDGTPPRYADAASAYSSGLFSEGFVAVNPGDMITITDLYPPGGIGEVAVEQVTPEPSSFAILGMGLLLGIAFRRLKKTESSG